MTHPTSDPALVRVEHAAPGVAVARLDRPARLNAFVAAGYHRLADVLEEAAGDDGTRALVLTGEGRAFCAGVDLDALAGGDLGGLSEGFRRMLDALAAFPLPLVAAVNGVAVGIGTTMLLHADLVLADPAARFRTPFPQLGVAPEAGSSLLLPERVGRQHALWMLLSGSWVDAADAAAQGLVWRVAAPGRVVDEAVAVAAEIAALPPTAVRAAKALVNAGRAERLREVFARELSALDEAIPGARTDLRGGADPRRGGHTA